MPVGPAAKIVCVCFSGDARVCACVLIQSTYKNRFLDMCVSLITD